MCEKIMVVFSSTNISEELVDRSISLAKEKRADLIILDIRDRETSKKVAEITENIGFMGEKVVGILKKDISHGRCDIIFQKLSIIEDRAKKNNIPYEIIVEKGPFMKKVHVIAKKKKVKTIIIHSKDRIPDEDDFEVIRI